MYPFYKWGNWKVQWLSELDGVQYSLTLVWRCFLTAFSLIEWEVSNRYHLIFGFCIFCSSIAKGKKKWGVHFLNLLKFLSNGRTLETNTEILLCWLQMEDPDTEGTGLSALLSTYGCVFLDSYLNFLNLHLFINKMGNHDNTYVMGFWLRFKWVNSYKAHTYFVLYPYIAIIQQLSLKKCKN